MEGEPEIAQPSNPRVYPRVETDSVTGYKWLINLHHEYSPEGEKTDPEELPCTPDTVFPTAGWEADGKRGVLTDGGSGELSGGDQNVGYTYSKTH